MVAHPDQLSNLVQIAGREYFDLQSQIRDNLSGLLEERGRIRAFQEYISNGRSTDNTALIADIANDIVGTARSEGGNIFVAVSGAAGLGKTRLSSLLAPAITEANLTCDVLPLDSFMLDRADRLLRNLSGYDPNATDLEAVVRTARSLDDGKSVSYRPYNHATGKHDVESVAVQPCDVVLIEGNHSFHPRLLPLLSHKLYLYAAPALAKELRFLADLFERSYSVHKAFEHADEEYANFEEHVLEYARFADRVVEVDPYWKYKM